MLKCPMHTHLIHNYNYYTTSFMQEQGLAKSRSHAHF